MAQEGAASATSIKFEHQIVKINTILWKCDAERRRFEVVGG